MTEFNEIDMFDKLSEEKFNYLLENKIDLIDLAHEDLPDEWLFKLIQYDSAALYTLSRRYFLLDKYSSRDFEYFYSQYLYLNPDISLWLLDLYVDCGKRKQLIDLCIKSDFAHEYLCRFRGHWIADNVSNMTNPEEIFKIYNSNSKEGIILLKIAGNIHTSKELLAKLTNTKDVLFAKQIRSKSRETMKGSSNETV